jgi:hypothetical protein
LASVPPAEAGSVSKVECIAAVRGRGEAKVAFFRHMAPLTLNAVLRSFPMDSRAHVQPAMVTLFTDLRVGVEKPRAQFARGDVAFLPSGGLICIFLADVKSERPLNPLGKVEEGLGIFDGMRAGDVVHFAVAPSVSPL